MAWTSEIRCVARSRLRNDQSPHFVKVFVFDSISSCDPLSVVDCEHLGEEIEAIFVDKVLVAGTHELVPVFLRKVEQVLLEIGGEGHVAVGVDIGTDVVSPDHFRNSNQLIIVVATLEERFLSEHHSCEHAARGPDVKLVVVVVIAEEELRCFEVARRHSTVEPLAWEVKVRETPIHDHG